MSPLFIEIQDIPSLSDGQPLTRIYRIDDLASPTVCVGGLTPETTYNVCVNASYSDRPSIDVSCRFTMTVDQDPAHIDTDQCRTPSDIIGTPLTQPTSKWV